MSLARLDAWQPAEAAASVSFYEDAIFAQMPHDDGHSLCIAAGLASHWPSTQFGGPPEPSSLASFVPSATTNILAREYLGAGPHRDRCRPKSDEGRSLGLRSTLVEVSCVLWSLFEDPHGDLGTAPSPSPWYT